MKGEIIAIGDELTSGRILNTTSSFAAGHLYGAGHDIVSMATVGDDPAAIETALRRALKRAEFIIVTGGLGATTDDMTNEAVAKVLGRPTTFYPEIFARLGAASGKGPATEPLCQFARQEPGAVGGESGQQGEPSHPLAKLAWLPKGSTVLKPGAKMAGHLLVHEGIPIFFLPGVPYEMRELMLDCVIPYLADWRTTGVRHVTQRIYKVFGLPEIDINQRLRHLENGKGVRIGYYPVYPEVHVSLTVLGEADEDTASRFAALDREIANLLAPELFGIDNDTMEGVVGRMLAERHRTVAIGESCTGGLISHQLTRIPGSSDYLLGGVVAYSNAVKQSLLKVDAAVIEKYGAVSRETARAMASGVRAALGADFGLAVTGIAGPGGGTAEKPVGTVCFGLASEAGVRDAACNFKGDRWKIQAIAAHTALDMLRRFLLDA